MARLSHYPPWRRIALQITMWVVFAISIGTAALVSAHLRNVGVAFDRAITCGSYTVRVPTAWRTISRSGPSMSVIESSEVRRPAGDKRQPRRLMFVTRTVAPDATPDDVLQSEGLFQIGDGGLVNFEPESPSTLGNTDTDVYVRAGSRYVGIIARVPIAEYAAAAVASDGSAIALKMTVDGIPDASDLTFFRTVMSKIERTQ